MESIKLLENFVLSKSISITFQLYIAIRRYIEGILTAYKIFPTYPLPEIEEIPIRYNIICILVNQKWL